jgi:hypothetical protein
VTCGRASANIVFTFFTYLHFSRTYSSCATFFDLLHFFNLSQTYRKLIPYLLYIINHQSQYSVRLEWRRLAGTLASDRRYWPRGRAVVRVAAGDAEGVVGDDEILSGGKTRPRPEGKLGVLIGVESVEDRALLRQVGVEWPAVSTSSPIRVLRRCKHG